MVLHEIHYKMPIYHDCTVGELLVVGTMMFVVEGVTFSLLTRWLIGYAGIGVAITFLCFFPSTKLALTQLQKMKCGKPHGYYRHWCLKKLIKHGVISTLFIVRTGKWSIRRMP